MATNGLPGGLNLRSRLSPEETIGGRESLGWGRILIVALLEKFIGSNL
jgi:hypothetical protein